MLPDGTYAPNQSRLPPARPENVTCTVSGTDVAVTGWSWTDAQGFETVTAPGGSLTWTGPGVTEGTVTASITVGGAAAPDLTAPLTVNPRTWSWGQAQWSYIPGAALICFSQRPVVGASAEWGWNVKKGSCDPGRILPDMLKNPQSGYDLAQVPDGPNKGYWYVTAAA